MKTIDMYPNPAERTSSSSRLYSYSVQTPFVDVTGRLNLLNLVAQTSLPDRCQCPNAALGI